MPEITINDIVIDVVRKNIKNLHLAIHPPVGKVRIAAPMHVDNDAIRLFVISKLSWIKKHKIKFAKQERQPEHKYVSGESHYFQGQRYLLNVIYGSSQNNIAIRNKTYLDLFVKKDSNLNKHKLIMNKWYRQQLNEQIPIYISKWEKIIEIEISSWGIKQMKTRWGSCNINKRHILLNLELAKKPLHCLEYVIVHELVHLLERKHNDRFIGHMDKLLPQWRVYRDELNNFILEHAVWKK